MPKLTWKIISAFMICICLVWTIEYAGNLMNSWSGTRDTGWFDNGNSEYTFSLLFTGVFGIAGTFISIFSKEEKPS